MVGSKSESVVRRQAAGGVMSNGSPSIPSRRTQREADPVWFPTPSSSRNVGCRGWAWELGCHGGTHTGNVRLVDIPHRSVALLAFRPRAHLLGRLLR